MQVTVESGEGLEKRLLVNLPAEQVNVAVDGKLKELARTVRMDGFRPGKVPLSVVKQRYGEQVKHDVWGELIRSSFYEAATQEKLVPVGEPSIELREDEADGGLAYTATFDVMPKIELADMSSVSIKQPVTEVKDADVDNMIDKLRKQRTTWSEVERASQDGDSVLIDFKGSIDGEVFDGGTGEDMSVVLGSGSMIPGFEDGLVGTSAGDEPILELTFPEDYQAEQLAGKDVRFEITVKKVSEPELPVVDEEFVKSLGVEAGDEASLREEIRTNMEREVKQKVRNRIKEQVMDALLEVNGISVPKAMVEQESKALKQQTEAQMAQAGQSSNLDLPLSVFEGQAERRVKLGMLVSEIVEEHKIEVDQARVEEAIEEHASSYENPQEIIDWYKENPQQRGAVENVVMEDQVVDWVLDQAQTEEENLSFDELLEINAEQ